MGAHTCAPTCASCNHVASLPSNNELIRSDSSSHTPVDWSAAWQVRQHIYHMLGNAFLRPLDASQAALISRDYWRGFPLNPTDKQMSEALNCLYGRALKNVTVGEDGADGSAKDAAQLTDEAQELLSAYAAEYTRLFVGPGRPAVFLWESMYQPGAVCLFGQPTFDMRSRLRNQGYPVDNALHQLEDHLGVQLLYLSAQAHRLLEYSDGHERSRVEYLRLLADQRNLIEEHLLTWIEQAYLQATAQCTAQSTSQSTAQSTAQTTSRTTAHTTSSFYPSLLQLTCSVLRWDAHLLSEAYAQAESQSDLILV